MKKTQYFQNVSHVFLLCQQISAIQPIPQTAAYKNDAHKALQCSTNVLASTKIINTPSIKSKLITPMNVGSSSIKLESYKVIHDKISAFEIEDCRYTQQIKYFYHAMYGRFKISFRNKKTIKSVHSCISTRAYTLEGRVEVWICGREGEIYLKIRRRLSGIIKYEILRRFQPSPPDRIR